MKAVHEAGMVAAAAVGMVAWRAPRSEKSGGRSVADIVADLRATGLAGRDLADAAVQSVASEYTHYSTWHLWLTPEGSLARGQGWSHQYNTVLLLVLRELGFPAHLVHAARVRGWRNPWWLAGHTWVKVEVAGRALDACAGNRGNRTGRVGFVPVTPELRFRRVTRLGVALALTPFVTTEVWRAWLGGRDVPRWIYRERPDSHAPAPLHGRTQP